MENLDRGSLVDFIGKRINVHEFKDFSISKNVCGFSVIKVWIRKTWNTNRAIAIIVMPDTEKSIKEFVKKIKKPIGRKIGYLSFFYPLGLQLVLVGENVFNIVEDIQRSVDRFDTQQVVLQSIYVLDIKRMKYVSARTRGQYVTGKFQDAIEGGIKDLLLTYPASGEPE